MKRVFVCSPLSAPTPDDVARNIRRAKRLCYLALVEGDVAPFAPHACYPEYLDDTDPVERELGLQAGQAWMVGADCLWVWDRNGVTGGMKEEIEVAGSMGIPVVFNPECWKEVDS